RKAKPRQVDEQRQAKRTNSTMSKKVFAPPVAKSYHTPFGKGELELHGRPEDGVTAKSMNMSPTQSKKQKGSTPNVEKKPECKKNLETIENVGWIIDFVSLSESFRTGKIGSPGLSYHQSLLEKLRWTINISIFFPLCLIYI
ncbi:hypothetical protein E2320_003688, partial [Naja naja]